MKKSLLMGLMACFTALSSFAVEAEEKVMTPQGKFLIQGADLCTNGTFEDGFAGWTANGVEKCSDAFAAVEGGGIVSQSAANTSGMYYQFMPTTGRNYVVSITLTQAEATTPNQNTRVSTTTVASAANFIQVHMNGSADEPGTPSGGVNRVEGGAPTEIIPGEPITLNFALVGDENDGRTAFIEFLGMNTNITINKVEIHEALKLSDTRALEPVIEYANTLLDCYDWSKVADPDEYIVGLQESLELAEAALEDDTTPQDDVDEVLVTLQEALNDFLGNIMDDQLTNADDKLPLGSKKVEKLGNIGIWKGFGGGANRLCTYVGAINEAGHYQQANSWGNGNGCIGIYADFENLEKGVYVFSIETWAGARENVKNSWDMNKGLEFAKAKLYCAAIPEEGDVDIDNAVASIDYMEDPANPTQHILVFNIPETGKYQIGLRTWAKDGYESLKYGSCLFMQNAKLYAKTAATYSKAQLDYELDVRGQIEAANTAIEKAEGYIADEAKSWGKDELAEAVETAKEAIAPYNEMDQDEIIETFDKDVYISSKGLEEVTQDEIPYRLLASEVYVNAVKDILEANRQFEGKNAHIDAIPAAIESANATLNDRVYTMAEGKEELKAAIAAAEEANASLRADEYSEENAAAADEAVATLNAAVADFKTTVPEDCYTTLVDIDFSNQAVQDPEEMTWSIQGKNGKMEIGSGYTQLVNPETGEAAREDNNFTQGFYGNEQALLVDMLRIGNGNAYVDIPTDIASDAIVQISFDFYYGNLNGKYAAWKVQSAETDEESGTTTFTDMLGLNCSKYDGKDDGFNTFGIDFNGKINGVGSSSAQNDLIAAETNKTEITITMDLATKKATCTTSGSKGTVTWNTAEFAAVPARFVIGSNYNVAARRCWFDNLKVVTIATSAGVKGDVNGDGVVNGGDAIKVYEIVEAGEYTKPADVNNDGAVNGGDAIKVYEIIEASTQE